jgi:hypothetical protein
MRATSAVVQILLAWDAMVCFTGERFGLIMVLIFVFLSLVATCLTVAVLRFFIFVGAC